PARLLLLETIAQASVEKLPLSWTAALQKALEHSDERIVRQAVATVRVRNETGFDDALVGLSKDTHGPAEVRLAALGAIAPRLKNWGPELFAYLRSQLDPKLPVLTRLAAASTLSDLRLNEENLAGLTTSVAAASAVELPYLLAAFER